jgi:uncharacterized membrane protein YccC
MTGVPSRPTACGSVGSAIGQRLANAGFLVPTLIFSLRTAAAGFAALLVGYALGLDHPQWAAMSAWACSQITREHLLSRGIYRVGGSVVGVGYAVLLVLIAQDSILSLALGLAFWGALCAFVGNLQRGYMGYGCMLAGYSASMVVLLHHGPASGIGAFAGDRMLTVLVGVFSALCISWFFAPRRQASVLIAQSRQAVAQVLGAAVAQLRQQPSVDSMKLAHLQAQLAQVDELLELYPEGSRTAGRTARAVRWQQHHALEFVYQLAQWDAEHAVEGPTPADITNGTHGTNVMWRTHTAASAQVAQTLEAVEHALNQPPSVDPEAVATLHQTLRSAAEACDALRASTHAPSASADALLSALHALLRATHLAAVAEQADLGRRHGAGAEAPAVQDAIPHAPVHRDWVGARQAGLRAGSVLLAFGLLWAATGWPLVAFGMLGLSVMLLVFSGSENPQRTMVFVLRGQVLGALLALLCQALVWPLAQSGWMMVWMVLPFALAAALLFAHKRTAAGGLDISMVMYILLAPMYPNTLDLGHSVGLALAIVAGPALAWLGYAYIFPTNAQQRMRTLAQTMVMEVPALAARLVGESTQPSPEPPHSGLTAGTSDGVGVEGHARRNHRMLRLIRWAEKTHAPDRAHIAQMGLALRLIESSMLELHRWHRNASQNAPALRRAARQAELTLRYMARWNPTEASPITRNKAAHAWEALAQHTALPPPLAAKVRSVAQVHLPALYPPG